MIRSCVASASAALLAGSLSAFDLVGVDRCARVVLAKDAEPSSRLAAQELTNYVFKITGRALPVVTEGVSDKGEEVRIGTLSHAPADVPADVRRKLLSMRQYEASFTGVRDGVLWIVGREEVGELYATYQFLERELGVRWFQAATREDDGEYVPRADVLKIADSSCFREPWFSFRRLDNTGVMWNVVPTNGADCALRNGYQVVPQYNAPVPYDNPKDLYAYFIPRTSRRLQPVAGGGGHRAFTNPQPAKKWFATHPEWYALVDGKRVNDGVESQYCLSNPEVRRRTADYIIEGLRKNGGKGRFLFGQVDTPHGVCQCENCLALDGANERASLASRKDYTTRFVKTVNAVCEMVYAEFPQADLWMWAYSNYRTLPEGARPDPRLKLYFCTHERCFGHALDDATCERNVRMLDMVKSWNRHLSDVAFYDYLTCTPNHYTPAELLQAHDLKFYKRMGYVGWKNEASMTGSGLYGKNQDLKRQAFPSVWQWLYVTGKLLWDPDLDAQAVLDDAESKYYGVAYPAMRKYHALRRKLWTAGPAHLGYSTGDQRIAALLDAPGAKEELLGCLDEADKLAQGDRRLRYRLSRDRRWLNEFWIGPNEKMKALMGKVMRIPETAKPPVMDGDPSDAAWVGAYHIRSFFGQMTTKPIPAALATQASMLFDKDNLYFLLIAKEPRPERMKTSEMPGASVWDEDAFEIFLKPPTVENCCYHLAVNARGNVWGGRFGGSVDPKAFGAAAKGRIEKDRYVIELTVPLKNIAPPTPGLAWKVQVCRNRKIADDLVPSGVGHYSIDGIGYTDILGYRPAEFGKAWLFNGSFEEMEGPDKLKGWSTPNGFEIVKGPEGQSVRLKPGQLVEYFMWGGKLGQSPEAKKFRYSLRASGSGKAQVWFRRYCDSQDDKAKHGVRRETLSPSGTGITISLTPDMKVYTGEHEIPANEWHSFSISAQGNVVLDDVIVDLIK